MKVVLDGSRRLRYTKVVEMTPEEFAKLSEMDEYDMAEYFADRMSHYDVSDDDGFEDMEVTEYKPKASSK